MFFRRIPENRKKKAQHFRRRFPRRAFRSAIAGDGSFERKQSHRRAQAHETVALAGGPRFFSRSTFSTSNVDIAAGLDIFKQGENRPSFNSVIRLPFLFEGHYVDHHQIRSDNARDYI